MITEQHPRLKISHFRLISAIAELGQLNAAATSLAMTQPAASRMLAEIERSLEAQLFQRHAKGMELTEAGRVLARHAHNLLQELRDTARDFNEFQQGKGGTVSVGAVTGGAVGYVVPAIRALMRRSPSAEVNVDVAPSDALIRGLLAGTFDVVLSRIPLAFDPRDFDISVGRHEVIDFVVRRHHPLARVGDISIAQLAGFEWVIQAVGSPIRKAVESALIENGAPIPENITNTTSLLVMIAMVVSSDAIAPMAREATDVLGLHGADLGLTTLSVRQPVIVSPYYLLAIRNRQLSPLANRLRDLVMVELSKPKAWSPPNS